MVSSYQVRNSMRSSGARVAGLALVLAALVLGPAGRAGAGWERIFVPRADLWARWQQHDPQDTRTIDHRAWQAFLERYLEAKHPSGINRVNYAAVTAEDRRSLEEYLRRLEGTPISSHNRREQLAYWMNAYNALTVSVVLRHYPVGSIRSIKLPPGLFTAGPWNAKLMSFEGEKVSLNDIEHRILRPIWRDPRIHYGLNCASLGCPNLVGTAYTAENTSRLLTDNAIAFVNHPRGASFKDGRLVVSSIYDWFEDDFGGSKAAVIAHLSQYARGSLAERLTAYDGSTDDQYDWALNQP
jgi:Protein of unknown function, DUF547